MLNEETNNTPLTDESETDMELTPTTNQAVMALANATSALANALTAINYTPTTWVDNMEPDINAANLNNIEQGILQATTAINSAFTAINGINSNLQNRLITSSGSTAIQSPPLNGALHRIQINDNGAPYVYHSDSDGKNWTGDILATKSDFTPKDITVTPVNGVQITVNNSKRIGDVCYLSFRFNNTKTSFADDVIATISENAKDTLAYVALASNTPDVSFDVNKNQIRVRGSLIASTYIVSGTFVVL